MREKLREIEEGKIFVVRKMLNFLFKITETLPVWATEMFQKINFTKNFVMPFGCCNFLSM